MHDIDRTLLEVEPEAQYNFEAEGYYEGESEYYGYEINDEAVFDETEEMELAAELLAVTDEAEIDQFLGALIKKAGRAAGQAVRSPMGRALHGILKNALKKALPVVGSSIGSAIGGRQGGNLGGKLASTAGQIFGLELEGLSPEDKEFETARSFVRFAGKAIGDASKASPSSNPVAAAQAATVTAAQQLAPGLLRRTVPHRDVRSGGSGNSGRWVRRGRKIIVLGL